MRTIAISNYKGGVGKTTTAVNLSAIFAAKGMRVLLVDLDPQASATDFFGRHEKYMSNFALLPFTTFTSKHVPSLTGSPRTGLPAYLTHPFPFCAAASSTASEEIATLAATAATQPANFLNCIVSSLFC